MQENETMQLQLANSGSSQEDILALSQALEEAQKLLEERESQYQAQSDQLSQSLAAAEDTIQMTNASFQEAQVKWRIKIQTQVELSLCICKLGTSG